MSADTVSALRVWRIWSAEYPEDGTLWEGEAYSLEHAKERAAMWCDELPWNLDGCDATGLPPLKGDDDE